MMNPHQEEEIRNKRSQLRDDDESDDHEKDTVMPGFRFHPTEEELVEFYLRRKVEGKKFNVELITFLDLYRYDPWELPALAAIGEKEWFFYVPRDRKYRNGDRPNRVTTSGYWKATGADRMIRTDNFRSIGLKKTLVFYSGKAPKGVRSSWIMNEYRLPPHEFERLQKAEISLCRVYKRTGVEDHPSLPRTLQTTRGTSSDHNSRHNSQNLSFNCFEGQSSHHNEDKTSDTTTTDIVGTALGVSNPINSSYNIDDLHRILSSQQALDNCPPSQLLNINNYQVGVCSNYSPNLSGNDLLMQQQPPPHQELSPHVHLQALLAPNYLAGAVQGTFPDRLWEWNSMLSEGSKDSIDPFK
ncbi:NAC domain-containing protein 35-like [Bidens hawaiensis]|uniref:NAC domain-containing protein 35-like n=1 Tax=Bidens hawaiensis TaxID=980011 RepID=UPI00404AD54A